MNDSEKLLWLFKEVYGDIDSDKSNCYTEVEVNDEDETVGVNVFKDKNLCWSKTKLDIVFEYLTKHLD